MSHRPHKATWHTEELGLSVKEHRLPNDDADQLTTQLPFRAGEGSDKLFLI